MDDTWALYSSKHPVRAKPCWPVKEWNFVVKCSFWDKVKHLKRPFGTTYVRNAKSTDTEILWIVTWVDEKYWTCIQSLSDYELSNTFNPY